MATTRDTLQTAGYFAVIEGYRGDCGGYSRSSGSALAVAAGRQGSAQMVVRLMSLPSSMRWPGTS